MINIENSETMIFKNKTGYSTTISTKNEKGEYENMFIPVQLPKGITLENKTKINISKGFLSFFKTKDNIEVVKLVIMEFKPI